MIHPNSIIQAAEQAERAAGTIEAAVHRLALMAEAGYGGNICALVELLGSDRTAEETRLRAENAELRAELAERDDILLDLMAFCGAHGVTAAQRTVAAMQKAEAVLTMKRIRERQSVLFQESAADKAARGGAS